MVAKSDITPLEVNIIDRFYLERKGIILCLNLTENNFEVIDNKYQIKGTTIKVGDELFVIKEFQKFNLAYPGDWDEKKPIGIVVEPIKK